MAIQIIHRGAWSLVLDSSEIIADDPGAGTPAIVNGPGGASATYWCAIDTGELDGPGGVEIPRTVLAWLNDHEATVAAFLEAHGG